MDIEKETLRDAIKKNKHIENECWINAITDNYQICSNTKRLREKPFLETLGRKKKTEDNIKDGITVQEVLPFFEKYGIQLRVYDYFGNILAKYEPEKTKPSL